MKKNIAVIFGGTNTEHEVSIASAKSVINHIDIKKYNVLPIFISKTGEWSINWSIAPMKLQQLAQRAELHRKAWKINQTHPLEIFRTKLVDVVFPVLHGPYGEDGTIQGMLEMFDLPYVGCGVLGSALCMDKIIQKQLCLQQGLPVAPFVFTTKHDWQHDPNKTLQFIRNKLHYPLFIKPANQGSSIGISKVDREENLTHAINHALDYDTKAIIEQGVNQAREIECAILGNYQPQASVLGEIMPSNDFYDYDAKYIDGKSKAIIPADLPLKITEKIQQLAIKAFALLNGSGLARVDFLVDANTLDIYLNELNTMPGFTTISMYPKLWQASGISYTQLLNELIALALKRSSELAERQLSFNPKLPWHQS